MKWKDRLLSSSLPLEYEVGKILTQNNFFIDFDYAYKRYDNANEKEFSIDIKAGGYYPFETESSIKLSIDLLLECKYRNPNVSWLFVKDINIDNYSNFSSKGAIKLVDEFSEVHYKDRLNPFPICETCLKGMEVNTQNGEVHDKGIIHGINQLVYSIPSLLNRHINGALLDHLEDVFPYIICPILITTADLRILNNDFSIENLKETDSIEKISTEVPYLKIYSDVYPSFSEHCENIFKNIPNQHQQKQFDYFKKLRKIRVTEDGFPDIKKMYSRPDDLLIQLQNGIGNDIFRETIVCNIDHFPKLLEEIKTGIECVGENLIKINSS